MFHLGVSNMKFFHFGPMPTFNPGNKWEKGRHHLFYLGTSAR